MEPLTIETSNFMKFVDDCTVYCLRSCGLRYVPLESPPECTTYFSNNYGEAVLTYHGAHDEEYRENIRKKSSSKMLTENEIQSYLLQGLEKCFQKRAIVDGILMYCSLYVDTAIFCFRYEKQKLINESMVSTVGYAFQHFVLTLFDAIEPSSFGSVWADIVQGGINCVLREREREAVAAAN